MYAMIADVLEYQYAWNQIRHEKQNNSGQQKQYQPAGAKTAKIIHNDREHKKRLHFDHTNKYSTNKTKNTANDDMQEVITTV